MPATIAAVALFTTAPAHASIFKGDTLDAVADVLSWIVLFLAPIVAIGVFLMVHILPEKIAEKRKHPQLSAIKTLCILSLFFGGMLWPIAWLWAYSKPVLHKLAYGTDVLESKMEQDVISDKKNDKEDDTEVRIVESKLQRTPVSAPERHTEEA